MAALAEKVGRPVKWIESRRENYTATTHGRDHITYLEVGAKRDGTITALKVKTYANLGGVLSTIAPGIPTTLYGADALGLLPDPDDPLPGARRLHEHRDGRRLPRRRPARGDVRRSSGRSTSSRASSGSTRSRCGGGTSSRRTRSRTTRASSPGSPTTAASTSRRSTGRSRSSTTTASAPSRRRPAQQGRYLGIGFSTYVEICGVAPSAWIGTTGQGWGAGLWESANVRVHLTGKVVVTTGCKPHGQGHETTIAQVVADELGVRSRT